MIQTWNSSIEEAKLLTHTKGIFGTADFFNLHVHTFSGSLYFQDELAGYSISALHISPTVYAHPGMGSYGSLWKPGRDFKEFIKNVLHDLEQKGASSFRITLPPVALWEGCFHSLSDTLIQLGFEPTDIEPSYLLDVQAESFLSGLDKGNNKRYKKGLRENGCFDKAGPEEAKVLYALLQENRSSKGNHLSLRFTDLRAMMQAFPDNNFWFKVEIKGKLAATAWVLEPFPNVWQVVYWGHAPEFDKESPVTFLAAGIWEQAKQKGIQQIDLGTARIQDLPNEGLIRYKKNLGAFPSLKFTFTQYFSNEKRSGIL